MSGTNGLTAATVRVDLRDGDWAEIRTAITYGDRVAVRGKLFGLRIDEGGRVASGSRELDFVSADLEGMRRLVVAWGGPTFCEITKHPHDGDCRPRPITIESISALPGEKGDLISAAVQARASGASTPGFTTPPLSPSSTAATAESTASASTSSSSSEHSDGAGTSS